MQNELLLQTTRDKTLKTIQELQIEILKELDRICRKNGIKYSLSAGSCLGQARHGGFIPWDDDIDVDMMDKDFDKFIEAAERDLDHDRFFLRCRKTFPQQKRTAARLELKDTRLSLYGWNKSGLKTGVLIDIFRWCYLPNDENKRREITTELFKIRCAEFYKTMGSMPFVLPVEQEKEFRKYAEKTDAETLMARESELTSYCGDEKTDWVMDDCLFYGERHGFPAKCMEDIEDVQFEGLTVMNRKHTDVMLEALYGKRYMEWLPPIKRISNHGWYIVDLDNYKDRYNLPDDYAESITGRPTASKMQKMQELSLDMADAVDEICSKHNLKYYVMGTDAYLKSQDAEELAKLWWEPLIIGMPREDYDRFATICKTALPDKYFYQNSETDSEYRCYHSRIRLNYTHIRETFFTKKVEETMRNGLFISIIPLDNTSNNATERTNHCENISKSVSKHMRKWRKTRDQDLKKATGKKKLSIIKLRMTSEESLSKAVAREQLRYANSETDYWVDGSGHYFKKIAWSKATFGQGERIEWCGHKLVFPENLTKYAEETRVLAEKNKYKLINNIVSTDYRNITEEDLRAALEEIEKGYRACQLNFFEPEEYQLSAIRYDEKTDKLLGVKDILGYE